jgi:spore coat polysaccharide biosynthesis predicted glycosyltransferase SpsG
MRYVLRADASRTTGAGHVMRSSAIAEELIARGEEVIFVGQISDLPWVNERVSCLGFSQIHDKSGNFISKPESDVLLLDSYEISIHDPFINPKNWQSIVSIVDELTPDYLCHLRIHPGLDSSWIGKSKTPILSGANYIPLRTSLSKNIRTRENNRYGIRIVVVAGGSDPFGLVDEIANILAKIPEQFEAYLFSIPNSESTLDSRFKYVEMGHQLDELMKDVDLVLTTASTSSLEFLASGLCVGVICAVDNQGQYYDSLGKLGVAAQLGSRTFDNKWELSEEKIHSLVISSELRSNLKAKAVGLIDFRGASRIVDAITTL